MYYLRHCYFHVDTVPAVDDDSRSTLIPLCFDDGNVDGVDSPSSNVDPMETKEVVEAAPKCQDLAESCADVVDKNGVDVDCHSRYCCSY